MFGRLRTASRRFFLSSLLSIALGAVAGSVWAVDPAEAHKDQDIPTQIDSRFREYAQAFPDIHFIRLASRKDIKLAQALTTFLGAGAQNVDYEHDAASRRTLLALQIDRIAIMLENGLPSATLFRSGTAAHSDRPYVCLITLDPAPFLNDPNYAARLMIADSDVVLADLSGRPLLNNASFLQFTLDHEVFHCIDAYLNGPSFRKTFDDLEADYQRLQTEIRADVYASLAYRSRHGDTDQFLSNLAAFRTLSLLDMDLTHYTAPAIRSVLNSDPTAFAEADGIQRVRISRDLAQALLPQEPFYARLVSGAAAAQRSLREEPMNKISELPGLSLPNPYFANIAQLKGEIEEALTLIAGGSYSLR